MGPRFRGDDAGDARVGHLYRWRRAPAEPAIPGALWEEIGFISQIFFDVVDSKAILTPEKRFRNELQDRAPVRPGPGAFEAGGGVQDLVVGEPGPDDLQAQRQAVPGPAAR